ncbi:outer membrane protein [Dyella sp. 2RAB6]|uniref:outer membrane protein n=1 Tax=Dyella sp. 2RAB6 TaxID=3232992 RepID=UPI003F90D981
MKHWISKAAVAAAMVAASGAALAADDGQFFVNGEVGSQTQQLSRNKVFRDGHNEKNSWGAGLRFGYAWNLDNIALGIETGYVNLGKLKADVVGTITEVGPKMGPVVVETLSGKARQTTKGVVLGGNIKYRVDDDWFFSGRGGLFRANSDYVARMSSPSSGLGLRVASLQHTSNQYYAGVGVGYDFNQHFGMSFNYDYYRSKMRNDSSFGTDLYGVSAEYRF